MVEPGRTLPNLVIIGALKCATTSLHFDEYNHEAQFLGFLNNGIVSGSGSMNRPRALVVEPAGNLWGSERVLLDFLAAVAGSPWQIAVCCPPDTPIVDRLAALPVVVYPAFMAGLHRKSKAHRVRAAAGLLAAALRFRPHLLYVNQAGATRIALLVGRVLRIPVIAHVRMAQDAGYVQSLDASADRTTAGDLHQPLRPGPVRGPCSGLPAEDGGDVQRLSASAGMGGCFAVPSSRTRACVCLCWQIDKDQRSGCRLAGNRPPQARRYTGARALFRSGRAWRYFSLELEELAADLGISERIHWHGFQEEIPSRIALAAALICPSRAEALGRVIFEAWDAGTIPVAWAGSGGPAEVIQASEGGLLYAEQTAGSLAQALRRALDLSPSARQQMVERGRQWLTGNCDPQAYGQRMLTLWQDVAKLP